ncbi:MAG: hypothetical protein ABIN67_01105 [Ferruginibacter sp.]
MTNLNLHAQKMAVWQEYAGTDSLGIHLQEVEDQRDLLYRAIIPQDKYDIYLQKKMNLVTRD